MKLYTRRGDDGSTRLSDGTVVRKDDRRVGVYGMIDELNAQLGVAVSFVATAVQAKAAEPAWKTLLERLTHIQSELFSLGAELATPAGAKNRDRIPTASSTQVSRLEAWIDEATAPVTPLKAFVLPGGDVVAAHFHVCRSVCRRAERDVVALAMSTRINPQITVYLNRLSDLLFAWARLANHLVGIADVPWDHSDAQPE